MADISPDLGLAQQLNANIVRQAQDARAAREAAPTLRIDDANQAQAANRTRQLDAEQRLRDQQLDDDLRRLEQNRQDTDTQIRRADESASRGSLLDIVA